MRLDRAWIEQHLPHQGRMCLLDEVLAWDPMHIRCRSTSHAAQDHALRAHGRLGAACGIEYAAQAMALHGALVASDQEDAARGGFLASVRGVRFTVLRLDDVAGDLVCEATRVAGDRDTVVYEFRVAGAMTAGAECQTLLSGRATIALQDSVSSPA
jgi:predicted hotdog family 3-hydroxylacyl-ACP dehydratase